MKPHHTLACLIGIGVLATTGLLGVTAAGGASADRPAARTAAGADPGAEPRRAVRRPTCRVVRLASGTRLLRPRGCVRSCRVIRPKRGSQLIRACTRPKRPPHARPSGTGLVGVMGSGATATTARNVPRAATVVPATRTGTAAPGGGSASTLVLYDTTGPFGWLGELYAMSMANLVSRHGSWTAAPVATYTAGMLDAYTATIYIGSTYDEPLPTAFLDDAYATTRPVIWIYDNIWSLAGRHPGFVEKYGWNWWQFDTSDVPSVTYKGVTLDRSLLNRGGIMQYSPFDESKVQVLATANRADGTTLPWAIRSGNLTYVGENPLTYTGETDRDLAFVDILFDALAPATPERHRALVRLEDIGPNSDPADLRAMADVFAARNIPFGFGVSGQYRDPLRRNGTVTSRTLRNAPQVVSAIRYLQSKGGEMINHGLTHQYSNVPNPYDGVSGNDFEFYRVTENADHTLNFAGPVAEDSFSWARNRMLAANTEFTRAGFAAPRIWEFPHYSSSVHGYKAAASLYRTRWERTLYFSNYLKGGTIDYSRPIGQRFPYVVRDVYGSTVLPENIGSYEPEAFHQFPVHTIDDIVDGADKNMVVRDGFASFYYHPFWGPAPLAETLDRLQAKGWTFVAPGSLVG